MKAIACISTPTTYLGQTKGQYPGYSAGTLIFETEETLKGVIWLDISAVLGSLAHRKRDGYTCQGDHIFFVTDEQIAALRALGQKRIKEETARQTGSDTLVAYDDINDMLRKNNNAAAAE